MLTGGQREGDREGEIHEWGQERREEEEEGVTDVRKGIKVDGMQARRPGCRQDALGTMGKVVKTQTERFKWIGYKTTAFFSDDMKIGVSHQPHRFAFW